MKLAGSAYGATFTAPATVSTVSKSSSSLADVGIDTALPARLAQGQAAALP